MPKGQPWATDEEAQPPDIHQSLHSAWFGPYLTSNLAMKLSLNVRPSATVEIKPCDSQSKKYPTVPNSYVVDVGLQNASDNISLDSIWPGITRSGLHNLKMSGPCIV